jgi:hypothetical protein
MSMYVKGSKELKRKTPYDVKTYGKDMCLKLYALYIKTNKELMDFIGELYSKTI